MMQGPYVIEAGLDKFESCKLNMDIRGWRQGLERCLTVELECRQHWLMGWFEETCTLSGAERDDVGFVKL